MRAVLAIVATLAVAPAAYAQDATIQAVDATLTWSPKDVTIKAGETVTWRYDGTSLPHNVESTSPNWTIDSPYSTTDPQPVARAFADPGVYTFLCEVHPQTMTGSVTVTDASGTPPPPPPPPPPSEQPWTNDQQAPGVLDTGGEFAGDRKPPRLTRVRLSSVRNGARVRFRLSERARVAVSFELAGITVKTKRKTLRAGTRTLTVRDPRMQGRYRVALVAEDRWGNRSRVKRERVTIR